MASRSKAADDLGGALGTSTGERIQILNGLSPAEDVLVLVTSTPTACCIAPTTGHPRVTRESLKRRPSPSSSAKPSGSTHANRVATICIFTTAIVRRLAAHGPHPARGVSDSGGRQRRRIASSWQRRAGASVAHRGRGGSAPMHPFPSGTTRGETGQDGATIRRQQRPRSDASTDSCTALAPPRLDPRSSLRSRARSKVFSPRLESLRAGPSPQGGRPWLRSGDRLRRLCQVT